MNNCCYQCEDRHLHCHAECEKYKAFRKELDERNDKIIKAKNDENRMREYETHRAKRITKRMTLLDYVYENVKDSANNFLDMVETLGEFVAEWVIAIIVYGTLPLWLIPYLIIKKRKEKGEKNENIS